MKIKRRLAIAFLIITIMPIVLMLLIGIAIVNYNTGALNKSYEVDISAEQLILNPVQLMGNLTKNTYNVIRTCALKEPEKLADIVYLEELNEQIQDKFSFLVLRKGNDIIYTGDEEKLKGVKAVLPKFGVYQYGVDTGLYATGEYQALIKQQDFYFPDETEGTVFLITNVGTILPQIRNSIQQLLLSVTMIIALTSVLLLLWIYRSLLRPLNALRIATNQLKQGNLDYVIEGDSKDEIGLLCEDFDEMRVRLKSLIEERIQYEQNSRELMSNISHDLKTPLTAIKGYAEGILDGVAATPEKRDKYVRTIYSKANDMSALVDELSFYSKIDKNAIPYNFVHVNLDRYFSDCVNELNFDLEVQGIDLGYFNYVEEKDLEIIADVEQLKRVINNIVGNSVKYMDKPKGLINIRLQEEGRFIRVEIEDNGAGIAREEIPFIFERFYRTDASRNSSRGGSGLGLSIAKKIIEEHGGYIWASGKKGVGTTIFFTLMKYELNRGNKEDE